MTDLAVLQALPEEGSAPANRIQNMWCSNLWSCCHCSIQ
jgi:hypothetical protein